MKLSFLLFKLLNVDIFGIKVEFHNDDQLLEKVAKISAWSQEIETVYRNFMFGQICHLTIFYRSWLCQRHIRANSSLLRNDFQDPGCSLCLCWRWHRSHRRFQIPWVSLAQSRCRSRSSMEPFWWKYKHIYSKSKHQWSTDSITKQTVNILQ